MMAETDLLCIRGRRERGGMTICEAGGPRNAGHGSRAPSRRCEGCARGRETWRGTRWGTSQVEVHHRTEVFPTGTDSPSRPHTDQVEDGEWVVGRCEGLNAEQDEERTTTAVGTGVNTSIETREAGQYRCDGG